MVNSKKNGNQIHGLVAVIILSITSILTFIPIFLVGLLKLIPVKRWQDTCTKKIDVIASTWCSINNLYVNNILKINWDITGLETLNPQRWYLVIANHQSWLDIVILHRLFNRKIPILKFFIKDQLKWIPLFGFVWWVMGCPFMKRYSKEYLSKNPHKKGQDLTATLKAIERFKRTPATIMSFIEGTRFTKEKQEQQNSPHRHLLKPKAGGISFVLSSMGQQIDRVLDVTIIYPQQYSLWDFLCKRIDSIKIHVRQLTIPSKFTSMKLIEDNQTQADFKEWLNQQWAEKDQLMALLK